MTLRRDARGASLVEQTLIVALVALVAIGAWAALGGAVEERVDCVAGAIGAGVSGPCAPVSASGDDGDARAARGAVRAPSPRASRESASVSAGAATGALSGRTIATGFGFATRAAPWATPSAAFRSPLVSPPSRRVFVPAPGSARGRGTATSLSDDATWAFDAAAAIWRAGLLNLVRVSDPDLRTAGARSTGAEARAAGARRAGVSSRTRAHRRPLGRFARRNRVAWQVALIALRVGTKQSVGEPVQSRLLVPALR